MLLLRLLARLRRGGAHGAELFLRDGLSEAASGRVAHDVAREGRDAGCPRDAPGGDLEGAVLEVAVLAEVVGALSCAEFAARGQ